MLLYIGNNRENLMNKLTKIVLAILGTVSLILPTTSPANAFIFGANDTDQSICANIGSGYDGFSSDGGNHNYQSNNTVYSVVGTGSAGWPSYWTSNGLLGATNWHCRYDNGALQESGTSPTMQIPLGAPLRIEKQDLQIVENSNTFAKELVSVEWDFDGNNVYEKQDTGPWLTSTNTATCISGCLGSSWTTKKTKSTLFIGETSFLSVGSKQVNLKLTYSDSTTQSASGNFNVVADSATAAIKRTFSSGLIQIAPVLTGETTYFDARGSVAAGGAFSKYEWDLDGDGSFETESGAFVSTSYSTIGTRNVSVRVTSRGGVIDTETIAVEVRKVAPATRPSISINAGNPYTNTKNVVLDISWPNYATSMEVSNDGGFPASQTKSFSVGDKIEWALDDSIYGLYTKVVYVRFDGGSLRIDDKVYSDDVVLDTTAPKLNSASSAKGSGAVDASMVSGISSLTNSDIRLAKKAKSTTKVVRIKTKAKDERSGLGKVQVALSASGASAVTVPYKTQIKVTVPKSSKKIWVRVSDGAGNWSKWKVLKAK